MPASERHEQTAAAAERVRVAVEGEDLLEQMRLAIKQVGAQPWFPIPLGDCGCPDYSTCMNVACPRRTRITCS